MNEDNKKDVQRKEDKGDEKLSKHDEAEIDASMLKFLKKRNMINNFWILKMLKRK